MKICPECDGRGVVLDAPGDVLSGRAYWTPCPDCGGSGITAVPEPIVSGVDWGRGESISVIVDYQECGGIAMKDESYWTRKLMAYLKENRRAWLAYKLADHFTAGIPDVVIVGEGRTCWFELKCLGVGENMHDRIMKDPLQFHDMCKIEQNGNPCWYVIFLPGDELQFIAIPPSYLGDSVKRPYQTPAVHHDFKWITVLVENKYAR
jgi:hypothetical protein